MSDYDDGPSMADEYELEAEMESMYRLAVEERERVHRSGQEAATRRKVSQLEVFVRKLEQRIIELERRADDRDLEL